MSNNYQEIFLVREECVEYLLKLWRDADIAIRTPHANEGRSMILSPKFSEEYVVMIMPKILLFLGQILTVKSKTPEIFALRKRAFNGLKKIYGSEDDEPVDDDQLFDYCFKILHRVYCAHMYDVEEVLAPVLNGDDVEKVESVSDNDVKVNVDETLYIGTDTERVVGVEDVNVELIGERMLEKPVSVLCVLKTFYNSGQESADMLCRHLYGHDFDLKSFYRDGYCYLNFFRSDTISRLLSEFEVDRYLDAGNWGNLLVEKLYFVDFVQVRIEIGRIHVLPIDELTPGYVIVPAKRFFFELNDFWISEDVYWDVNLYRWTKRPTIKTNEDMLVLLNYISPFVKNSVDVFVDHSLMVKGIMEVIPDDAVLDYGYVENGHLEKFLKAVYLRYSENAWDTSDVVYAFSLVNKIKKRMKMCRIQLASHWRALHNCLRDIFDDLPVDFRMPIDPMNLVDTFYPGNGVLIMGCELQNG